MRWLWFLICAVLGLALLAIGLLVPMHLRAVDAGVLEQAGRSGPALLEEGRTLAGEQKFGHGPDARCRRRAWRNFPAGTGSVTRSPTRRSKIRRPSPGAMTRA